MRLPRICWESCICIVAQSAKDSRSTFVLWLSLVTAAMVMVAIFLLGLFTRNHLKIIVIATSIGGILQYLCGKYVENHPEIFEPLDGKNQSGKKRTH
jgi:hypothetical protein